MGSMTTTKLKEQPQRIQDRYGYRPTSRLLIVVGAVLCVLIAGFGGATAYQVANPDVVSKLLAWNAIADDHTSVTFEVRRNSATAVECALRVQNKEHHDLGYAIVTIPPGSDYDQQTYQVATNSLGYAAELLGCEPVGNLAVPTPDFPPGTSNPPQPWRP